MAYLDDFLELRMFLLLGLMFMMVVFVILLLLYLWSLKRIDNLHAALEGSMRREAALGPVVAREVDASALQVAAHGRPKPRIQRAEALRA